MAFTEINNLKIFYDVQGDGDVIFFLHHGFGCSKIWKNIYPKFVDEGFKVVVYDRRGYGQSEAGDDFMDFYTSNRYRPESVEELRLLKENLGIGSCHLVGQCEGGVVGVDYAIRYPEEIKTLTVASTQCFSEVLMTELNLKRLVNNFKDLETGLQAKMIEWHGDSAAAYYNQFA